MQISFQLAKQGWMKDFAGKWTIQPLNERDHPRQPEPHGAMLEYLPAFTHDKAVT